MIDVGAMRWGRDPEAGGGHDRVLADGGPGIVELRIPWTLLTMADPSSRKAGWPVLARAFARAAR